MLGYDDPYNDNGAGPTEPAAYFSNVRVVELAPLVTSQATNVTIPLGGTATFTVTGNGSRAIHQLMESWRLIASAKQHCGQHRRIPPVSQ